MRVLIDFLPWLFFAIGFWVSGDILTATIILLPATLLQIFLFWLLTRSFEKMHLITLAAVVVFGGATIIFQDSKFIQWKPTIVNWIFAAVFLSSHYIGTKKPIVHRLLGSKIKLPDKAWKTLSYAWTVFFVFSGIINIVVAYQFDEATWVNFKLFGQLIITLTFVFLQTAYIYKYIKPTENRES